VDIGGGGKENINLTVDLLKSHHLKAAEIHTIIISHSHADHMGAISFFQTENESMKVITHVHDAQYLRDNSKLNHVFESDITNRFFPDRQFDVLAFYDTFCPISEGREDQTVTEGDILACGDYRFHVIHTPGHHPGHISLYEPGTRSLFAGDMIGLEVPFYNVRSGCVEGMISTLNKYENLDAKLIIPSHGELIDNPARFIDSTLAKLNKREARLMNALSKTPIHFKALLPVVFRDEHLFAFPGVGILRAHLEKLKNEGAITEAEDHYRLV